MTKPFLMAIALTPSLLLGACSGSDSSSPDAGERMSMRGDMISKRAEAWANGQDVVSQGQRLIEEGNDRVADGQKKMAGAKQMVAKAGEQIDKGQADAARGEQLVDKGQAQMLWAEASYAAIRDGPSAVDPPSSQNSTTAKVKVDASHQPPDR